MARKLLGSSALAAGLLGLVGLLAGAMGGCSDDDPSLAGRKDATSDAAGKDTLDPATTDTDEEFWAVYNRRNRLQTSGETDFDTIVTLWRNPKAATSPVQYGSGQSPLADTEGGIELTQKAFASAGGLSCQYGCFLSPDLKWIAVAKGGADVSGHFTFALGAVDSQLRAVISSKFGELQGVKHVAFAGPYLFYSKKVECLPTGSCQYEVRRSGPLGTTESDDVLLTRMAPDDDPDWKNGDSTYTGYFRVSDDGSTVVFQTPTIRSSKVWAWRDGKLARLDFLCPNLVGESCVGSGSEYTDRDPVAVSADGKEVVVFSVVDRWLRVHRYQVGTEVPPAVSNLVEVPADTGSYRQAACGVITEAQHAEVKYDPWFSADGKSVFFVGYSMCGTATDKPWTDLLELPTQAIGGPLSWSSITNWTNNPRNNTVENRVISGLGMSPARKVFLLRASAYLGSNGKVLADTDQRHKQDTELYSLVVGSRTWVPITNEGKYDVQQPKGVQPR